MLRRNHDQLIGCTVTVKDILSSINYLNGSPRRWHHR